MIIDVHAHLGNDRVFDEMFSEEEQWEKIKQFGVDFTILQPALVHTLEEAKEQHDTIATLCKKHPDKFAGMANPNPHLKDQDYENEVKRCINDLGFVGIKIHPYAHGVNPTGRDGQKVIELARELKVPVMMHTGSGLPFASPINAIPLAQKFPDVQIIIAHCGMMVLANETFIAMKNYENLYADISWTGGFIIREWVHALGANRFMFATDHADNCGTELTKVRTSGLTEVEQDWILAKTAIKVFKLSLEKK